MENDKKFAEIDKKIKQIDKKLASIYSRIPGFSTIKSSIDDVKPAANKSVMPETDPDISRMESQIADFIQEKIEFNRLIVDLVKITDEHVRLVKQLLIAAGKL